MKRIITIMLAAGMLTFVACGPSAEEKAAAEKMKQDSIASAQKMVDDSIAAVNAAAEKAAQDAMMAAEQAKADSIAMAEAAKKHAVKPKKTNDQKIQENKKIAKKEKG